MGALFISMPPSQKVDSLLVIDFLLRRSLHGRYSFISRISKLTTDILGLKKISINAGPKLFAANMGFLMSVSVVVLYYSGLLIASYVMAGALVFFTILESIFNFCVACVFYPFVSKYIA